MIENLPTWITLLFIIAVLVTIVLFHLSNNKPTRLTVIVICWSIIHSVLAYTGFYQLLDTTPPRFGLVLIPSLLMIIWGLLPQHHKWLHKNRSIHTSSFLHAVRLPVEIVLYGLLRYEMIPALMTFEGRNFDILMGISAPIIGVLILKKKMSNSLLLAWNIIGLILICTILFYGVFSAELPFQQFGFDQPNQAMKFFPFVLLPSTIVPIVIWTHISDIILLVQRRKGTSK